MQAQHLFTAAEFARVGVLFLEASETDERAKTADRVSLGCEMSASFHD